MDKLKLRAEIDLIDKQIIDLLVQRLEISKRIGYEKLENNIELYDKEREDALIKKLCESNNLLPEQYVESLYRVLLESTRKIVKKSFEMKGE